MLDLRDVELDSSEFTVCPCGSKMWVPEWVQFYGGEIVAYAQEMKCMKCGSLATPPMP